MSDEAYVQHAWFGLMRRLGITDGIIAYWFAEIRNAYLPRPYHNLAHLRMCLELLESRRVMLDRPEEIIFAIFFHDLVIKSGSQKNELFSAEKAKLVAEKFGLGKKFASSVHQLVMATTHTSTDHKTTYGEDHIMDVDLAIFGTEEEVYDAYAKNIRAEYSHMRDEDFYRGRSHVLKKFVGRENIYRTGYFRDKFQDAARANLKREIESIRKYLQRETPLR